MRLRIALWIVVGLGICTTAWADGFAISIKPAIVAPSLITLNPEYGIAIPLGAVTSAAQFGYRTGHFLIAAGLEYSGYSGEDRDLYRDTSGHVDSSSISSALRYSMFLPEVSARYYFGSGGEEGSQPDGSIRPYVGLSAFYSIGTSDVSEDGVRDTATMRELNDDLTGDYGGTVTVGAEYSFNQSFSIGGEFGLRLISTSVGNWPGSSTTHNETGAETNAALCLNYYFQ